jgi:hypothetical protein
MAGREVDLINEHWVTRRYGVLAKREFVERDKELDTEGRGAPVRVVRR